MILNVILILIILNLSRCSRVIDSHSQKTIYVSSYCPAMKFCNEGTHVMCMHYDHSRTLGHLCKNYVKVTITPDMVQQILQEVNNIRMKVSLGKETGKNDRPLPRGYGMMKMHWDSELATLAQVLADQCLGLKEDECRATDKFPNPSQIITLINFKVPDWEYLSRNTTERGLTTEKINFAIVKALKSLHAVKKLVNSDTITKCPALEKLPDMGSRSYLKLIRGKATHIGCGISAFTRYQMLNRGAQNIYNSVQIVCNVSDGPVQSQPVYMTDPPILGTGFTEICGCPHGYKETMGCLCDSNVYVATTVRPYLWRESYDSPNTNPPKIDTPKFNTAQIETSKFAIHKEAPKFDSPKDLDDGEVRSRQSHSHISSYEQAATTTCKDPNQSNSEPRILMLPIFDIQDAPNANTKTNSYEADNELERIYHQRFGNASFFPDPSSTEDNEITDEKYRKIPHGYSKNRRMQNRRNLQNHKIPDVYLKNYKGQDHAANSDEAKSKKFDAAYTSIEDAENHQYSRQNNDFDDKINLNVMNKDENTFLYLLDHLEQAVKNIELEGDKREIFDIKMRKIYESALKTNGQNIKKSKSGTGSPVFENDLHELTEYLKEKSKHSFRDDRPIELRSRSNDDGKFIKHAVVKDSDHEDMDRKDYDSEEYNKGIDNKLIYIMNKKNLNSNPDRIYHDYFNNKDIIDRYNVDRVYDETNEYNNLPASRNQEKINKYDKIIKEAIREKNVDIPNRRNFRTTNYKDHLNEGKQNVKGEDFQKFADMEIKKHTFGIDPIAKNYVRNKNSYTEKNSRRMIKSPGYRRTYETEHERPTIQVKTEKTKLKSVTEKYYISDRAML